MVVRNQIADRKTAKSTRTRVAELGSSASFDSRVLLSQTPDPVGIRTLSFVPLSPDFLAIARLYLEKYSILADEDRKLYRGMLLQMANPLMLVNKEPI